MKPTNLSPSQAFNPDVMLYHAECTDGFGAAWAVWKRFPTIRFIPVKHGMPPPQDLDGSNILIADFSYPRNILEQLATQAKGLLVLDHHITAQQALEGLPYAHFDMNKSGAVLAWEWAHRSQAPWLLQYVQDKDLWNWALPHSREITAALASYPLDFEVWSGLTQEHLEAEGRAILRYENELVDKIAAEAILLTFHGFTIPCVHSAILTSQLGERLGEAHPFAVIWHDRGGRRYISLRSREDQEDVGAIAAAYGGGGHTHSAGFSFPLGTESTSPFAQLSSQTQQPPRTALSPSRPR